MANFNPGLNPTSDPNYEGVRGPELINVEGHNKETSSRRTAESIFAGLKAGVVGADNALQQSSRNELESGYEKLIGAQGVDLAAGNAVINPENTVYNPSGGGIPDKEQQFLAEGMDRLTAARDQGKLSNTHYYAQLEAMVRNVKSRYPGYNEIIDRQIEGIAGVKPANALRQSMLHDLEKAAAANAEKLDTKEKFILNHAQHATQADRDNYNNGKITTDQMVSKIQDRLGAVQELEAKKTKLAAEAAEESQTEERTLRGASDIVAKNHNLALTDVSTLAASALEAQRNGTYDPTAYGTQLQSVRLKFMEKATKDLQETLGTKVNPQKLNELVAEQAKRFDDYAAAFTDKDSGHLARLDNQLKAMQDKDTLAVLGDDKIGIPMRSLQVANRLGGKDMASIMFNNLQALAEKGKGPDIGAGVGRVLGGGATAKPTEALTKADASTKQIIYDNKVGTATGTEGWNQPKKLIESLHKVGKDQPVNVEMAINSWVDNLTNPQYPTDFAKNSARALFAKDNKDFLTYAFKDFESRKQAFGLLTSPKVTEAMENVKKSDPETYKAYREWAYGNYKMILNQSAHDLEVLSNRPYLDLKFDEKTGHLNLVPNAEGEKLAKEKWYNQSIPYNLATLIEKSLGKNLTANVRELNAATDNVTKILKADGYDPGNETKNMIAALAQGAPKEKAGVWNWIARSIQLPKVNPEDLSFGGTHPSFTEASGTLGGKDVMAMIAKGESGSNYNRLVDTPTHPKEIPLTDMTIREVLTYQKGMLRAGNESSAAGKYQVVSKTLKGLVDSGVVGMNDKYDEATQDKIANALLEGRGYKDYLEGRMPLDKFLVGLGKEWEIIKVNPSLRRKVAEELKGQRLAYAGED